MGIDPISISIEAMIFSAFASMAVNFALQGMQEINQRQSMRDAMQAMKDGARGHMINLREPLHEVPLVYGRIKVGINKVFVGVSGNNNDYLHIIGNLGEGPIEGLATEDKNSQDPTQVDCLFIDDKRWDEWGPDYIHYEIFTGTPTQGYCTTLHDAVPEWQENKRYTAYIYIRIKYDLNKFQGEPNVTAILKGLKVRDPRTTSTGSVSLANMRLSLVNGAAFVDFGVANVLTGNLGSKLTVTDSAGKKATGWIKAAGTGETYGSELLSAWNNGSVYPYETFVASGGSITNAINTGSGNGMGQTYSNTMSLSSGALYRGTLTFSLTSGGPTRMYIGQNNSGNVTNSSQWPPDLVNGACAGYITAKAAHDVFCLHSWAATQYGASSMSLKQVTAPSSTGVTIVSSQGGATRNWESVENGFNFNDSAGYTYELAYQELWSENPALILRDMLTRPSTRGGMGISTARIDDTSFGAAATYCDTKGWKANADIRKNTAICDNLILIENTFRGRVIFSETRMELRYMDLNYETPVVPAIRDFIEVGGVSSLRYREPNIINVPNCMKAEWISPTQLWQVTPYIHPDTVAIAAEGDYREGFIDLTCVTDFSLVQKLVVSELERRRHSREASFIVGREYQQLEPYDVIPLTSNFYGWDEKLFRVTSAEVGQDGSVSITAAEEFSFFYDDDYDMATEAFHTTNVPSYLDTVPSVMNVAISEELYVYGGRTFTRLKVDFDPPSNYPWYKHTEIWVKIGSDPYKFETISTSDFVLDPVQEGQTYQVKMVNVSIFETKQAQSAAYSVSHPVVGKTSAPSAPSSVVAIPTGDTVQVIAPDVNEPDLVGWELRLGSSWDAAIFLALGNNGQFFLTGFRPGTHTFWVAPKNNRGYYSATKRSSVCQVLYPPGYTDKATWSWDFRTGNHDGTVYDYVNGAYILKVSRGNIARNGAFESNINEWTASNATLSHYAPDTAITVVATQSDGAAYQDQYVKAGRAYDLKFKYANVAGDRARYSVYDLTNGAYIINPTTLADSSSWSALQTFSFTSPAGCKQVRYALRALNATDQVYFHDVQLVDNANSLTGTWTSPEYDFASVVKRRVWGDFVTQVVAGNMSWSGVIPAPLTWNDVLSGGKRWYELFTPTAASSITGKIYYGTVTGNLTSSFTNFHFTAPEFESRYVKAEVSITDPVMDTFLNLAVLNMKAAFWQ